VSQLADTFVKDPAAVVRPQQRVRVTVTEVDLARGRIALSLRSNPVIGPKSASPVGGPRPGGGPGRSAPAPAPKPPAAVNSDWFSAALSKKR